MDTKRLPSVDIKKLSSALPGALGKTLHRVFIADHQDGRFQLVLVFTDGTHYELYGSGSLSGARDLEGGDSAEVRRRLALSPATVAEVGQAGDAVTRRARDEGRGTR